MFRYSFIAKRLPQIKKNVLSDSQPISGLWVGLRGLSERWLSLRIAYVSNDRCHDHGLATSSLTVVHVHDHEHYLLVLKHVLIIKLDLVNINLIISLSNKHFVWKPIDKILAHTVGDLFSDGWSFSLFGPISWADIKFFLFSFLLSCVSLLN